MHNLYEKYNQKVNFLAIYIVEAHAIDEWPVGDPLIINQPISINERCGIAREFVREYKLRFTLLVDNMKNDFSEKFAAWPVRFFVLHKQKIIFKAHPDQQNTYDTIPPLLDKFLGDFVNQQC